MLFSKLALISTLAALAAAQDTNFDFDNIPAECTDVCSQVGAAVNGCKNDSNDDSQAVLQCICTANNANTLIPNCEACVRQYNNNNDDDDDSDQYRLLTDCSYSTTTVAAGGAGVAQTTAVDTNTISVTNTEVVSTTSVAVIVTTGSDGLVATTTETNTNTVVPTATNNPAAIHTVGAAMGLGALGFALGML